MYLRSDTFVSHLMLALTFAFGIGLAWVVTASAGADSNEGRSIVFSGVGAFFATELVLVVIHGAKFGWDSLSASMAIVRLSIANYFLAMGLNFGNFVDVPTWYFSGSRWFLWFAVGPALIFLIREAVWAFIDLTGPGRKLFVLALVGWAIAMAILILSF